MPNWVRRCRERLSRRTLSTPTELGRAGVSQTNPLQQARQRRALRGLEAAATFLRRGSRGLQIAAQLVEAGRTRSETGWRGSTSSLSRGAPLLFTNCLDRIFRRPDACSRNHDTIAAVSL